MIHLPHEVNFQSDKQPVNAKLYQQLLYTDGGDCKKLSKRDMKDLLFKYKELKKYYEDNITMADS